MIPGLPDDFPLDLLFDGAVIDQSWRVAARCARPGVDPDWFFPGKHQKADAAKAVCETCPVRGQCLEFSQRTLTPEGVWGGVSARPRRTLRGQILRGELAEPAPVDLDDAQPVREAS